MMSIKSFGSDGASMVFQNRPFRNDSYHYIVRSVVKENDVFNEDACMDTSNNVNFIVGMSNQSTGTQSEVMLMRVCKLWTSKISTQ